MKIFKLYFRNIIKLLIAVFIINLLFIEFYQVKKEAGPFGEHAIISYSFKDNFLFPNTTKLKPDYRTVLRFRLWIPIYVLEICLICYFKNFSYNRKLFIFLFLISIFNGSKYKSISYLYI